MVAYSFKPRFVDPILSGRKRQTIRAVGRRRHARPSDEIQIYTGMRTRACRLIGRAICVATGPVDLRFRPRPLTIFGDRWKSSLDPDLFARLDGFADWRALADFWEIEHPAEFAAGRFEGILIQWRDFKAADHA